MWKQTLVEKILTHQLPDRAVRHGVSRNETSSIYTPRLPAFDGEGKLAWRDDLQLTASVVRFLNLHLGLRLIGKIKNLLVEISSLISLPAMISPQHHIPFDANVLGTIGTVLRCIQTTVTCSQILVYRKRWSAWRAAMAGVGLTALLGGIEVTLVFLLSVVFLREHLL